MSVRKDYPENRLDIRIDEDGSISYMQSWKNFVSVSNCWSWMNRMMF